MYSDLKGFSDGWPMNSVFGPLYGGSGTNHLKSIEPVNSTAECEVRQCPNRTERRSEALQWTQVRWVKRSSSVLIKRAPSSRSSRNTKLRRDRDGEAYDLYFAEDDGVEMTRSRHGIEIVDIDSEAYHAVTDKGEEKKRKATLQMQNLLIDIDLLRHYKYKDVREAAVYPISKRGCGM